MAKIRKGDKVLIIAGKDRLKTGLVERVLTKENRVIVDGVNMVKKSIKRSSKDPQGGIIDKTMPIHLSNVMLLDASGKPTRVGYRTSGKEKVRYAKVSDQTITKDGKK